MPTGIDQGVVVLLVTYTIVLYFVLPELCIGFGKDKLLATLMSMPETAINEDSRSVFAHDYIRLSGYTLDVQAISISMRPQPFPHKNFRLGCLTADMRHAAVALGGS